MPGSIFLDTLRRGWRGMLIWGVAIALLSFSQVAIAPSVDSLQQMSALMESMPPFFLQMFGATDMEYMATPEGYLALQYFSFIHIVFAVYAVLAGMNVTANEEDRGILDFSLSLPIARVRYLVEKTAAYLVMLVGVIALSSAGLVLGAMSAPALGIDNGRVLVASLNLFAPAAAILAVTVLLGAFTGRRARVGGLAAVFVTVSYFVDTLGRSASGSILADLRALSVFTYTGGTEAIRMGLNVGGAIGLIVVTIALVVLAALRFDRRDVGVG